MMMQNNPGKRRMLIVEDEQDISDCLQTFFSSRGFAVNSAFSGEEAIAHLKEHPADVVLLDILLPGLSGIEVLKRVKEFLPHAKIIMVTGLDQTDLRNQAYRYGAAAYITKPFDFSNTTWAPVLTSV